MSDGLQELCAEMDKHLIKTSRDLMNNLRTESQAFIIKNIREQFSPYTKAIDDLNQKISHTTDNLSKLSRNKEEMESYTNGLLKVAAAFFFIIFSLIISLLIYDYFFNDNDKFDKKNITKEFCKNNYQINKDANGVEYCIIKLKKN